MINSILLFSKEAEHTAMETSHPKLQMLPFAPTIVLVAVEASVDSNSSDCVVPRSPSSASSSIGACCNDFSNADEDDEIQSALRTGGPLDRMDSLESSLPLKRGLSQFFDGKSRSFTSLKEVSSAEQLSKPVSPYNKRRRTNQPRIPSSKSSTALVKCSKSPKLRKDWSSPLLRVGSLFDVKQQHRVS